MTEFNVRILRAYGRSILVSSWIFCQVVGLSNICKMLCSNLNRTFLVPSILLKFFNFICLAFDLLTVLRHRRTKPLGRVTCTSGQSNICMPLWAFILNCSGLLCSQCIVQCFCASTTLKSSLASPDLTISMTMARVELCLNYLTVFQKKKPLLYSLFFSLKWLS